MFNDFLRKMKDDFLGTRYSAFWDKVAQGSVCVCVRGCVRARAMLKLMPALNMITSEPVHFVHK